MTEEIRLNASKLGTKEYISYYGDNYTNFSWNQFYQKEIENFSSNKEDTGECWFDDSDAEGKMVQFLIDNLNDGTLAFDHTRFIDLGTGNGHLLFQLHEDLDEEYEGTGTFEFKGIDYSPDSVKFASDIAAEKYPESGFQFEQVDLLTKENEFLKENAGKYDILLDKGTLDAIALNQDPLDEFSGRIGMEIYAEQVVQLMHPNSVLLITSCNFTEDELVKIITANTNLTVWKKITYPSFQFGGVKGSTICSIAFKQ